MAAYWVGMMVHQMDRLMVDGMAVSMAVQTAATPVEEKVV